MSNTNRDYLIICDVKNSKITINRPIKFYVTDKNTSNIFIRLVTKIEYDNNINKYVDIEPASNYVVTMRIIKPNNEIKSIIASKLEEGAMYQVDLQDDCKDISGTYKCELLISTTVYNRQELNTSNMFTYKVEGSILSSAEIIETKDVTAEDILNRVDAVSLKIEGKANITDLVVERTRIDSLTRLAQGSTTGDAELIDGRIGANGVTYSNVGNAIRTQINMIAGHISASNTLTIEDGFSGSILNADIFAFKGQIIEVKISCDSSILANDYGIPVGVVTTDNVHVDGLYEITPNKTYKLKLNYNIKQLKTWIGGKLANGDVTLNVSTKSIYEYTNELNDSLSMIKSDTSKLDNKLSMITDGISVSRTLTIGDDFSGNIIPIGIAAYKRQTIEVKVSCDSSILANDYGIPVGVVTTDNETINEIAEITPNKLYKLKFDYNIKELKFWIGGKLANGDVIATATVKNIYNYTNEIAEELEDRLASLKYQGLTFSILGDSYSSYKGWIPEANEYWYADEGNSNPENDVASVTDTWWYKLSKDTGMSLLINNSYSGSTVSTTGYSGGDATGNSFTTRMVNTLGEKRVLEPKPNIIFIFGGTNDSWANSPIGELKYSDWSTEDLKSFLPAFCYMIAYIKKYNPQARIINIINEGLKSEITNGMSVACQYYNIENVVLNNIGKTGGHPNKAGMEAIKNQIISIL